MNQTSTNAGPQTFSERSALKLLASVLASFSGKLSPFHNYHHGHGVLKISPSSKTRNPIKKREKSPFCWSVRGAGECLQIRQPRSGGIPEDREPCACRRGRRCDPAQSPTRAHTEQEWFTERGKRKGKCPGETTTALRVPCEIHPSSSSRV